MYKVYKLQSPQTPEQYVGSCAQSLKHRLYNHLSQARSGDTEKDEIIRSYDDWTIELLFETSDRQEAIDKETYYIELFDTINNGLNTKGQGTLDSVQTQIRKSEAATNRIKKECSKCHKQISINVIEIHEKACKVIPTETLDVW